MYLFLFERHIRDPAQWANSHFASAEILHKQGAEWEVRQLAQDLLPLCEGGGGGNGERTAVGGKGECGGSRGSGGRRREEAGWPGLVGGRMLVGLGVPVAGRRGH